MGSFYSNVTLRHDDAGAIAASLRDLGRTAYVTPPERGAVVVFDEGTEDQDVEQLKRLPGELSRGAAASLWR